MPEVPTLSLRAVASTLVLLSLAMVSSTLAQSKEVPDRAPGLETLRAGQPLGDALTTLRGLGLDIFYTSHLVRPEMKVAKDVRSTTARVMLDELLAPHDLHATEGPGGRLVIVAGPPESSDLHGSIRSAANGAPVPGVEILSRDGRFSTRSDDQGRFTLPLPPGKHHLEARLPGFVVGHFEVELLAGERTERDLVLEEAPVSLDAIIVVPSRISLMREDPVTALDLDRREIFQLPHFGDDIFRALTLLPGITGEESSARFNVRGSRADEVLVLLDRIELFEPYHLKDFGSRISIIPPRTLREVNLITGGFPAQYGDRMSGVLDMTTQQPEERKTLLGLSLLNSEISSSGVFGEGRGQWLASGRRSNLDVALDLLDIVEQPKYWGTFLKVDYSPQPAHRLTAQALYSDDSLNFFKVDPGDDRERFRTRYNNAYAWLTHQWIASAKLFAETTVSKGVVERDRRGEGDELAEGDEGLGFDLDDRRRLDVLGSSRIGACKRRRRTICASASRAAGSTPSTTIPITVCSTIRSKTSASSPGPVPRCFGSDSKVTNEALI